MKKIVSLMFLASFLLTHGDAHAQTRHLVRLRNKAFTSGTLAAPAAYLSAKSVARRVRYGIVVDSTDLPVAARYLDSLRAVPGVTVLSASKWLNQVAIRVSNGTALSRVQAFPFVVSTQELAARRQPGPLGRVNGPVKFEESSFLSTSADTINYGASAPQIRIHNGHFLHRLGLRGDSMLIGVLDAGFANYLNVSTLDSTRRAGRILDTYDFVAVENSVNEDDAHGLQCLTVIAANRPGVFVGAAPHALFSLYRTEDAGSEYPIEEHNWVCGAERADSLGSDLISSSLGYYTFDAPLTGASYTYADMNGNRTMTAIGAGLAAKKGLLVVNAAGNEGNGSWKYIISPADGDSVLAVGAVNTNGAVGSFSSFGPSSDGQVKPDVASVGVATVLQFPSGAIGTANGTSFATPNMAGLAACLWQGFPEYNNIKILQTLRSVGSIASAPNDRIGFGIPNMKTALVNLTKEFATTTASYSACKTTLSFQTKAHASMRIDVERQAPGESGFTKIGEWTSSNPVFKTANGSFADTLINRPTGTYTYRLRQYIDTAAATLTVIDLPTVSVNVAAACVPPPPPPSTEEKVWLSPNPTRGQATLEVTTNRAETQRIRMIDAGGKVVYDITKGLRIGRSSHILPTARLAAGTYYVQLYFGNGVASVLTLLKL